MQNQICSGVLECFYGVSGDISMRDSGKVLQCLSCGFVVSPVRGVLMQVSGAVLRSQVPYECKSPVRFCSVSGSIMMQVSGAVLRCLRGGFPMSQVLSHCRSQVRFCGVSGAVLWCLRCDFAVSQVLYQC